MLSHFSTGPLLIEFVEKKITINGPFPNCLELLSLSESCCSLFHFKIRFQSHANYTCLRMNCCTPGHALIEWLKGAQSRYSEHRIRYFEHRQNYLKIEGKLKITLDKDR